MVWSSALFSDVNRLTYSVSPRDCGVGEGSWAGLCFNPTQWSMVFDLMYLLDLSLYSLILTSHIFKLLPAWQSLYENYCMCACGCKLERIGVEGGPCPCLLISLLSICCCISSGVLQYSLCPLPESFPARLSAARNKFYFLSTLYWEMWNDGRNFLKIISLPLNVALLTFCPMYLLLIKLNNFS